MNRRMTPTLVQIMVAVLIGMAALAVPIAGDERSPIQRAIDFLAMQQVRQPLQIVVGGGLILDFPGNWPQFFELQGSTLRVRDVSPFSVAFIHHALTHVVEENRWRIGLDQIDLDRARVMRRRATGFMRSFASPAGTADAGTYAFWPYDVYPATPDPLQTLILTKWLKGPVLGGHRVPINLPVFPSTLAIPSDADVTATTYATLLDDALFDGGPGTRVSFERFFVDWRDVGLVPRRLDQPWLPPASGAFLTWLTYRARPWPVFPNDVDLVVNANVLYALGRYKRLDVPGVADAIRFIDFVITSGLYGERLREITEYYPDNLAFQYMVSRAFHEGSVAALESAVAVLADDLVSSALVREDGAAYWDQGDPHLNTAFAVLTLLNGGRDTPLIDAAIRYLMSEQGVAGGYPEATFFVGRNDGGQVFEFMSASFTTAIVLEALARHEIAHCGRADSSDAQPRLHRCNR